MKVILTGGTGLIGRALADDLSRDGHEAIILSRGTGAGREMLAGIRLERWDGKTSQGWGKLADGADAIVNLAGENLSAGRWTAKRKQAILESRTDAGAAVMQAIQQAKSKPWALIQGSAVGYYGASETELFDEGSPPASDFMAKVVKDWEASTKEAEELGVRRAVVRLGVVLSTKSGALPRMILPYRLFAGGPIGSGKQWISWVHIDDVVSALKFLIEHPEARGPYNLSAQPVTNRGFARAIGKAMRRPAIFPVPAFVMQMLFGEMSKVLLEGQRVSSRRLIDLGFSFQFPDVGTALEDLLHHP